MSKTDQGVTYWDVAVAAREIAHAHGCHLRFTLDLPIGANTGKAFNVRCACWCSDGKGNWYDRRGVSEPWPNIGSRTFAGLLLRLVYDLDQDLTAEEAKQATRQATRLHGVEYKQTEF